LNENTFQISDFGLAKLMPQDLDLHTTTRVLGTFGYFDPEYALVWMALIFHIQTNNVRVDPD
jgi:hypothetical protein